MSDRFVAGAIAGSIGASIQVVYGYLVEALGIADRSFEDFGEVFIMSANMTGTMADFVGIISQLSNGAIFGIIMAYIISLTSIKFYIVKGLIYGTILWHLFLGLGTMYKMPGFINIPPSSSLAILVGSLIYGVTVCYVLRIIDAKSNLI